METPGEVRSNAQGFPAAILPEVGSLYTISERTASSEQPVQAAYMGIGTYNATDEWGFRKPGFQRLHTFMSLAKDGSVEVYVGPVGPHPGELKVVWMDADEDTTGWPAPYAHRFGTLPQGPEYDFARQRLEALARQHSRTGR